MRGCVHGRGRARADTRRRSGRMRTGVHPRRRADARTRVRGDGITGIINIVKICICYGWGDGVKACSIPYFGSVKDFDDPCFC